jgi:hypothetical protein
MKLTNPLDRPTLSNLLQLVSAHAVAELGGTSRGLGPPNASYNKLIYTHKPGLEAIFREILHAWPPLMDNYHVWPPLSIIPASAPGHMVQHNAKATPWKHKNTDLGQTTRKVEKSSIKLPHVYFLWHHFLIFAQE